MNYEDAVISYLVLGLSGFAILSILIIAIRKIIVPLNKNIERNKAGKRIAERFLLINEGKGDLDDHLAAIYKLLSEYGFKLSDFKLDKFKIRVLKAKFKRAERDRRDIEELIREVSSKPPGK